MAKELSITPDEKFMLHLLDTGMYDGVVGRPFKSANGYIICYGITCGIPEKYISHPNKIGYQSPRPVRRYKTDGQRLVFLMEFGHYMPDEIFQEYSKKSGMAITLPKSPRELAEEAKTEEIEAPPPKTETELHLLERLNNSELDGPVGLPCDNGWGSMIWYWIEDGTIKRFKQGPTKRFFNGDDNEKIIPDWKPDRILKDEDEQLDFLRRSGRHMKDPEVQAYSDQYWDDFWKQKHHR